MGAILYRVRRPAEMTHKGKSLFGLWSIVNEEILVSGELQPAAAYCTFLHELIHAIDYDRSINLSEKQTDQLANGLAAIFYDDEEGGEDDGPAEDREPNEGVDAPSRVPQAEAEGRVPNAYRIVEGDRE